MDIPKNARRVFALVLPAALIACAGPDDRAPSSPVARFCSAGDRPPPECTGTDRPAAEADRGPRQATGRDGSRRPAAQAAARR